MSTHFCKESGIRIAAPGVSETVDPKAGQPVAEAPAPPPERMPLEQQQQLVRELEEARRREALFERQLGDAERRGATDLEALRAEHAAAVEKLKAEHAAEISRLRDQHTAELDALTRPAAATHPTEPAGPVGEAQEEPPTADAVPKPNRKGGNR